MTNPRPIRYALLLALAALCLGAPGAGALDEHSSVPVLLYHSRNVGPTCSADDTDVLAFARDAAALRAAGYALRPLLEVAYWQAGIWHGNRLPPKVAAISFDDGFDRDWISGVPSPVVHPNYPCPGLPSVREIAERDRIPVTFFVIGSRVVRGLIQPDYMNDNWWLAAEAHALFSIGNHSIDHDHIAITRQILDPAIPALLPAAGHADGGWAGTFDPGRWTNYASATFAIQRSARHIHRVTGRWPRLLAYPMGHVSGYVRDLYLPLRGQEHGTVAAFCTETGTPERFVSLSSDRWCLPRVSFGVSWRTEDEFAGLLGAAP